MASGGSSQAARRTTASEDRTYSAAGERIVGSDHANSDEDRGRVEDEDLKSAAATGMEPSWGRIAVGRSLRTAKAAERVRGRLTLGSHRRRCYRYSRGSGVECSEPIREAQMGR